MFGNKQMTQKSKNKNRIRPILLAVVITTVISVFISFVLFYFVFFANNRFVKLKELEALVKNNYYGEYDETDVVDALLDGYIDGLGDKYSDYLTAEETEERHSSLEGNGKGIGVIVSAHPDTGNIFVKRVYDDCPASKAGILAGDQITAIDGVTVEQSGYTSAVDSIIRDIGDTVTLTVLRDAKSFDVSLTYSEFKTQTVFGSMVGEYAYIAITSFNNNTPVQFENTVNRLISSGAEGIIFDVRSNGGGTVDSVTEMVDFLCPEGTVMSVKYSNGKKEVIATSDASEINLPMVVLTDGNTASAAELFTASLKDFGKGVSIGSTTYGKGVMQTTFSLSDGSSAVLTVAEFFPNSGKSFNGVGISPDIEITLTDEQKKYIHLLSAEDDPVITAAVKWLKDEANQ